MEPSPDTSPPLSLEDYVNLIVARRQGELVQDQTVRDLLQEVGIGRSEEEWIERGAPEVLYSEFLWAPEHVDDRLSDDCLATLGLACVLRGQHQLLYWQPMIEMGKQGRFRGHLASLEETRDLLRAIARQLIEREALMRSMSRLQPRLAQTLGQVLKALPTPTEESRDREILIPEGLSEEDVPTGDDEDVYARDTAELVEDDEVEALDAESDTAPAPVPRAETGPLPPEPGRDGAGSRGGTGLVVGVLIALAIAAIAALLALKYLV